MGCPVCKRLERTFEGWNTEYLRARSSLYCQEICNVKSALRLKSHDPGLGA